MCVMAISWQNHEQFPFVILANRDEFYSRPARAMSWWASEPDILAGQDELKNGTWFGINENGRWAVVTNFRDPADKNSYELSRGLLVRDFLYDKRTVHEYASALITQKHRYAKFNLIFGDLQQAIYVSSELDELTTLQRGLYSLSNATLHDDWHKTTRLKKKLEQLLAENDFSFESAFSALEDRSHPEHDSQVQRTGLPIEVERALSPVFVALDGYGTRASTVMLADSSGKIQIAEKSFLDGKELKTVHHEFRVSNNTQ
ncbi:MAG: NRDE family protein [Leptospiraceae bacterium]|nr:NRDE family protein [Leptospiraceae bacterium]